MTGKYTCVARGPAVRAATTLPVSDKTQSAPGHSSLPTRTIDGVRIRLWRRDDNQQMEFELTFPTIDEKTGRLMISRDLRRSPKQVLRLLEALGVKFDVSDPEDVVREILMTENLRAHRLTPTPGWHDGVFVPARGFALADDANNLKIRVRVIDDLVPTYAGHTAGTSDGWRREVGAPAKQSTAIAFAILVALAPPLVDDVALPEGVLFNLYAATSTGKSTAARVGASVAGDPKRIGHWNFTARGVEEYAAAHNGYPFFPDDSEKAADNVATLMRIMTHIVTGGQSKIYSASVHDRLRTLEWFCFGLTSSPESMSSLARRKGQERTGGEKVRLVDLPVPNASLGGVFDRLLPGTGAICDRARAIIDQLDHGIARHHGELFWDWLDVIDYLAPGEASRRVKEFEATKSIRNSFDGRLLRKFAVVRVAGDLAVKHGILDWSQEFVADVVDSMLEAARSELQDEEAQANQGWLALREALADPDRVLSPGARPPFGDACSRLIGIRQRYRGAEVVAFFGDKVRPLFAGNLEAFIGPLRERGALMREPGRTDADTVQLPPVAIGSAGRWRPRAYAARVDRLDEIIADRCRASA